jgi:lipopolysaccharide exporter
MLIQRANPTRAQFDTAWTLNLIFALLCAGLIVVLAPLAARFYSEPRLTTVMFVLAGGWMLQGFENIGIVNFRRRMDFSREFAFSFSKRIVGFVVTLALAYMLRSYWALIAGQMVTRAFGVVLSYAMEPYRPRPSLAARSDLLSVSSWVLISNVMGFGLARLPHFLVGRVEGSASLGMYTIASEFARLPSTELSAPINRAVFPGLARLEKDRAALARIFTDVMGLTVVLTMPASIGLALIAGPLVDVVLGPKWAGAAPLLSILAVSGAIEVIAANNGIVYLAISKTHLGAALSAVKLLALVVLAMLLVPRMGVMGMAASELIASSLLIAISCVVLMRTLHYPARSLINAMWRPLIASACMGVVLVSMLGFPWSRIDHTPMPLWLIASICIAAVAYVACLFMLWWIAGCPTGAEATLLARARVLWTRWRPAIGANS